jgi:hypothetical protein
MLVVTGTALTKNTPAAVLRKLECAEPNSSKREEQVDPTGKTNQDERQTLFETSAACNTERYDQQ